MMLNVTRFNHAADFLDVAGDALYQNEALNSLMIGIAERLAETPHFYGDYEPYLGVVSRDGEVILASIMTPPFGLLVVPLDEDAGKGMALLLQGLLHEGFPPPDVHGVKPYSRQFAELWAATTGGKIELDMAQRMYRLEKVSHPEGIPGHMLQAKMEHLDLVAEWVRYFDIDSFGKETRSPEVYRRMAVDRITQRDWYLWQDGEEIVSMCLRTRPTRTGCSVGGVYTPPEKRRRGYATACVAALSQKLLDEGFLFTSLFTDLSNPTSNSIYMKIGYQPLADFDKYRLVG
jgi:predicted GNAT family acetyltransferase